MFCFADMVPAVTIKITVQGEAEGAPAQYPRQRGDVSGVGKGVHVQVGHSLFAGHSRESGSRQDQRSGGKPLNPVALAKTSNIAQSPK